MGVVLLGGGQDLAQVVHRPLDQLYLVVFWMLDDDHHADDSVGGGDVEDHGLFSSRSRQDRRHRHHALELEKAGVRMIVPLEASAFLHELVQRECLLAQPTDEVAEGCQAPSELLDVAQLGGFLHLLDGLDLYGIALDTAF